MVFVVYGLNHKTAPLTIREKAAVTPTQFELSLHSLFSLSEQVDEVVILSTCNRTELYCITTHPEVLALWFANTLQLSKEELATHFYCYAERDALRHTLRVACGLDSMMLGEPQILGQLKQAYLKSQQAGAVKMQLKTIFDYVFKATKEIRRQSDIGKNSISVASAAAQLINKHCPDETSLTVFIIGSGELASAVANYLQKNQRYQFLIASRTTDHAAELANQVTGHYVPSIEIGLHLKKADVVISATACPLPFITKDMVHAALRERNNAPIFFLDLAVPRDIEHTVIELDNVSLFNVDDLNYIALKGLGQRQEAALHAEELIEKEATNYYSWNNSLKANDLICLYRTRTTKLAEQEFLRAINKLNSGQEAKEVLKELTTRLTNKLSHIPTTALKFMAAENSPQWNNLNEYLLKTSDRDALS